MDGPIPSEPPQPRRRRQPSGMPRSWDPSIAHIRSSFGGQVRSTKPSQPQFSFGSDERDALDMFKIAYVHKNIERSAIGRDSPGPYTAHQWSSVGAQPLSVKKSHPSWGFGMKRIGKDPKAYLPGPGAYYI